MFEQIEKIKLQSELVREIARCDGIYDTLDLEDVIEISIARKNVNFDIVSILQSIEALRKIK